MKLKLIQKDLDQFIPEFMFEHLFGSVGKRLRNFFHQIQYLEDKSFEFAEFNFVYGNSILFQLVYSKNEQQFIN